MTTATEFIEVSPIISVGMSNPEGDAFQIIPFYHVKLYQGQTVKKVLVNYTFVTPDGRFESDMGVLKKMIFESIIPKKEVKYFWLEGQDKEEISKIFLRKLWALNDGDCALFAWERIKGDDQAFYSSLGLMVNGKVNDQAIPVELASLGLGTSGIFKEVPYNEWAKSFDSKRKGKP